MRPNRVIGGRLRLAALLLTTSSLWAGCAKIGTRPIKTEERLVRESTEEALIEGPGKPIVTLDGTTLRLEAVGLCQKRSVRHLEEVQTNERYMESDYAWYVGGAGIAALTAGTIGMVDASNVYSDDTDSRTYNETGQDKAFLANGALLATGVAAGTLLLVDVFRASGTEQRVTPRNITAEPTGDEFPCAHKVLANEPVMAIFEGERKAIGVTNAAGRLQVDLDAALPATFYGGAIELALRGRSALKVDVAALQQIREDRYWAHLDVEPCQNPIRSDSCDTLKAFVGSFPDGAHSAEAKALLDAAEPTLIRLGDEETWSAMNSTCKTATFRTADEGHASCAKYREYLARFPDGAHAREAKQILTGALHEIDELARLEEAAHLQRSSTDQAARKADAERIALEQRNEGARTRDQCYGACRMDCANNRDRGICDIGCREWQCDAGSSQQRCRGECKYRCSEYGAGDLTSCLDGCMHAHCGGGS